MSEGSPEQLQREMRPRRLALIAWMDSQNIPEIERAPLLAWVAGTILAERKTNRAGQEMGMVLLDMFIGIGIDAYECNDV